jgi:hypothetical protein
VNTISIILAVLGLSALAFMSSDAVSDMIEDDTVKQELALAYQNAWIGMVVFGIAIVCSGLGLFGGCHCIP